MLSGLILSQYAFIPQEVKDLIDNASDEEKISIYTQCRMYSEDELDEWAEKMAAYYGDGWHTRMSGDSIVNIVSTGTTWYKYELTGYDADIVPDLDMKPVYPVPVDDAKIMAGYGYIKSESGSGFHFEDDFSVEQGSDVKAVADGKVLLAGWEGIHGISVVTQNDDGYMTSYYHLSTADVNVGDRVANGSYLRANLIQLGYTFDSNQLAKTPFSSLRLYLNVNNAFLITAKDFNGYDPESTSQIATSNGAVSPEQFGQNMAFFSYPRARTFTLGVNVTF